MSIAATCARIADDFARAAVLAGIPMPRSDIEIEILSPHRPPVSLPAGRLAVYVFAIGDRCLKAGKAGPRNAARFCLQHYGTDGRSTLAKSLLRHQASLGIRDVNRRNVRAWICEHTQRANFLIPSRYGAFALALLESFVHCRLHPEFEGSSRRRLGLGSAPAAQHD